MWAKAVTKTAGLLWFRLRVAAAWSLPQLRFTGAEVKSRQFPFVLLVL